MREGDGRDGMFSFIKRRHVAIFAAACIVALAAAVTVSAYAGGTPTDRGPIQLSPSTGAVPLIQGSMSDVIAALESRFPLVSNARVVAETVPAVPDPNDAGQAVSGLEVLCDLSVSATQGSAITEALWERDLFTGALRDEFIARGFGAIIDANATLVTPDGSRQPIGGGVSPGVIPNQVFDPIPSGITSTITEAANSIGLASVKVTTMQGLQDVLVIHAVSDSPSSDVGELRRQGDLEFLLGQAPVNFEGVYLEIDNSAGSPVYIVDTAPRDGGGGWWSAPSLGLDGGYPTATSTK
jgi:hypothetical protein